MYIIIIYLSKMHILVSSKEDMSHLLLILGQANKGNTCVTCCEHVTNSKNNSNSLKMIYL